jgi:hypothetical protein
MVSFLEGMAKSLLTLLTYTRLEGLDRDTNILEYFPSALIDKEKKFYNIDCRCHCHEKKSSSLTLWKNELECFSLSGLVKVSLKFASKVKETGRSHKVLRMGLTRTF